MNAQTVTQAYLLGIGEGRSLLRDMKARGEYDPERDIPAILATLKACLAAKPSRDVAGMYRGERDFWLGQRAKLERN